MQKYMMKAQRQRKKKKRKQTYKNLTGSDNGWEAKSSKKQITRPIPLAPHTNTIKKAINDICHTPSNAWTDILRQGLQPQQQQLKIQI